jgi:hypothetical protein
LFIIWLIFSSDIALTRSERTNHVDLVPSGYPVFGKTDMKLEKEKNIIDHKLSTVRASKKYSEALTPKDTVVQLERVLYLRANKGYGYMGRWVS